MLCPCGGTITWIEFRAYMDTDYVNNDQVIVNIVGKCDACGQVHRGIFGRCLGETQDLGCKVEEMD